MAGDPVRLPHYRWIWILSIWLGFGLVDAAQTVFMMRSEGMHHAWTRLFFTSVVGWLPWALATPLVMRLAERLPPVRLKPVSTWLVHAGACVTLGLVFSAWTAALDLLFNPFAATDMSRSFAHIWLDRFYNGLLSFFVLYVGIVAVSYVLESSTRLANQQAETARLNQQLSQAQLDALRRQIEPHFLFNALNAVAGLVREGRNDDAVHMIAGLSDFLRRVLEGSTRQQVRLEEELEFALKYLDIQKARFGDRLQFSAEVSAELYQAQVPSLILQPMVENAVKHGISKRVEGGTIRIAASRNNGMLTLRVYNDGPPVAAETQLIHNGIGISNVRTRLQSLYGKNFHLSMTNQKPDGVEVTVAVPFQE